MEELLPIQGGSARNLKCLLLMRIASIGVAMLSLAFGAITGGFPNCCR
jgi:hypothetical protein